MGILTNVAPKLTLVSSLKANLPNVSTLRAATSASALLVTSPRLIQCDQMISIASMLTSARSVMCAMPTVATRSHVSTLPVDLHVNVTKVSPPTQLAHVLIITSARIIHVPPTWTVSMLRVASSVNVPPVHRTLVLQTVM